jgi:hypothetical protein
LHRERPVQLGALAGLLLSLCFLEGEIVVLEPDRPGIAVLGSNALLAFPRPDQKVGDVVRSADRLMAEEQGLDLAFDPSGCGAGGHDWTSDHVEIEGIRVQIPDGPEFTDAVDLRGPARHVVHVHEADVEIENGVSARPPQIDVGERSRLCGNALIW